MRENPYYDNSTVRSLDGFFGRREIIQAIFTSCRQRQCFSLVGTRKIGKSSILTHMLSSEIKQALGVEQDLQRHLFICIDMRYYAQHTLEDFFHSIYTQIVDLTPKHVVLNISGDKGHELFARSLQDLHKAGYHLVLIMDEFDKVADEQNFGPNFFSFLRASSTAGGISYVTASRRPLYEISPSEAASSPFFDSFTTRYIGALHEDETRQLITEPARRAGLPFSESDIAWTRELAGRHSFFLQITCRFLFEEKARLATEDQAVDYPSIAQAVYDELTPLFHRIWKELAPDQQRELKQDTHLAPNARLRLEELREGLLFRRHIDERQKHGYGKFQPGQQLITTRDVKDALAKFGDRTFLQNSPLASLSCLDISGEGVRGQQVQDLLKKAFERMKPGGTRTDSTPEWRLYNTLYYRYFNKGFSNEQAAARLNISLRQFYRDRDQAIQSLLHEIFDLDMRLLHEENE